MNENITVPPMEIVLKDGRTGTVSTIPQNGYVQVHFPFFVTSSLADMPHPSEISKKFDDLISLDDLTDESRHAILNPPLNDDEEPSPPKCEQCNDTGRHRQLDKIVDCDKCSAAEDIRRQTDIDQHNAAAREALRKQLCEGSGSAMLRRDADGRITIDNPD